jgi:hypothetical protein
MTRYDPTYTLELTRGKQRSSIAYAYSDFFNSKGFLQKEHARSVLEKAYKPVWDGVKRD